MQTTSERISFTLTNTRNAKAKDCQSNVPNHYSFGVCTFDTITVTKEDRPHFESVDCSPLYFHTITAINTTNNAIDSVVIINPDVSYDTSKKHIYIYFKHRN